MMTFQPVVLPSLGYSVNRRAYWSISTSEWSISACMRVAEELETAVAAAPLVLPPSAAVAGSHSSPPPASNGLPPLPSNAQASALKGSVPARSALDSPFAGGSPCKTVSFVESPMTNKEAFGGQLPYGSPSGHSALSGADFGWEDHSDAQSTMSGYSACSGDSVQQPNSYLARLVRFYQKYNPEKLARAEEFLAAYKGEEDDLFKILTQKYGPEPPAVSDECQKLEASFGDNRSDTGSMYHFAGDRVMMPKVATAAQGRTDLDTPYWPGNRQIGDTDLLSLLRNLRTDNEELSRCYLGVLAQHPSSSFNGMVYVTRAAFPSSTSDGGPVVPQVEPFLDHFWSGRLANNKTMVQQNIVFARTVLHCTEECQKGHDRLGPHERWRLTIYKSDSGSLSLYRTMWDPVIDHGPPPLTRAQLAQQKTPSEKGDTVPYVNRRRPADQPIQPVGPGASPPMVPSVQPLPVVAPTNPNLSELSHSEPPAAVATAMDNMALKVAAMIEGNIAALMQQMELRVERKLNDIAKRVEVLELASRERRI